MSPTIPLSKCLSSLIFLMRRNIFPETNMLGFSEYKNEN